MPPAPFLIIPGHLGFALCSHWRRHGSGRDPLARITAAALPAVPTARRLPAVPSASFLPSSQAAAASGDAARTAPRSPVPGPLRSLARGGPWRPVSPEPCPSAGPGPLPAVPQSHPQLCQWTACPVPLLMSACVLTQESLVYDCGVGLGFLAGLSSAWHAAWLVGIRSTSPLVCCRMLPGRHETARAQPARPGPWRACRPPVWLCCGDAFSGTFVLFF